MQQLKTIAKQTKTNVESVHVDTVYTVLQNAHKKVADECMEADCTSASYYINTAKIYTQLADLYAANMHYNDYIALAEVMQCFTDNITYYDESWLYEDCVQNTAMQKVKLLDYTYLSN
jgi:5-enolpyruvylshikimate-3-phosphate synthase